jgi:hypothetical protein
VQVGAYVRLLDEPPRDPVAPAALAEIEGGIDRRLDLVHYFFDWGRPFDDAVSENVRGRGLLLTLKPDDRVPAIAAGEHDAYLDEFARQARDWGRPVHLRFGHEMNGEWMAYSAGRDGGPSAEQFKAAWIRVAERVRGQGADNVHLVWAPNERDVPARDGNRLEDYWPGAQWVDVAAFDAYNWSSAQPRRGDGRWRSFEEIVEGPYDRITALTDKDVWLTEFGTTEAGEDDPDGASKEQWFRDMFASTRFPRLTTLVYFSEDDQRDTQRDWRLDSSPSSLEGFAEGWTSSG